MKTQKWDTAMLVKLALLTAVSIVLLMLIRIPFPLATFLVYDPADIPIYIASFAFGPIQGLVVTFVVCIIQAFLLGGDGLYGFIMHFVATGAFALIAGYMYQRNKTKKTAIIALITGAVVAVAIMCVLNIFVTSAYMGVTKSVLISMIPTVILPFNLIKVGVNGLITFLVYKKISRFLHSETGEGVAQNQQNTENQG